MGILGETPQYLNGAFCENQQTFWRVYQLPLNHRPRRSAWSRFRNIIVVLNCPWHGSGRDWWFREFHLNWIERKRARRSATVSNVRNWVV
jgi:hypothetical protein